MKENARIYAACPHPGERGSLPAQTTWLGITEYRRLVLFKEWESVFVLKLQLVRFEIHHFYNLHDLGQVVATFQNSMGSRFVEILSLFCGPNFGMVWVPLTIFSKIHISLENTWVIKDHARIQKSKEISPRKSSY